MLVYHGSYAKILTPDLTFGRHNLDFGKGFYTTTLKEQAEKWAKRRVISENLINNATYNKPVVNIYEFDEKNNDLNILYFDGYNEKWLDFIVYNRSQTSFAINHEYDVIYGNVADDDVARVVNDYMELLNKNRVNEDVKRAFLYQLQFSKPNNQYCFISDKGIKCLVYKDSYIVEDDDNGR